MTTHLPECWATDPSDPPAWCICDELRACEERVLAAAVQRVESLASGPEEMYEVADMYWAAVAAIEALRGEPNG
jgi:hypothetical protein